MRAKTAKIKGFTLVEVMLAIVILAFIAIGVSQNLVMTRGIAETNIRESTAVAAASGYLEQVKSMDYDRVVSSVRDPGLPVPTVLSQGMADPIYLGQWMEKSIVIDEDPQTGKERRMPFHLNLTIENLEDSGNGSVLGITILFGWEDAKTGSRRERSLRTMRSFVPTF